MTAVACFTSASLGYLDRARVLLETVRRHHPDWHVELLLPDEPAPAGEAFDAVVPAHALGVPAFRAWAFGHDVVELCTAAKGFMLERLLADGWDAVVYLDPDIALFAPLDDVLALLAERSVVLTPHLLAPEADDDGVRDNEIGALQHGTFNLGFLAVRNDGPGRAFAGWWRERLHRRCWDAPADGLFVDQRWCDLVPALFDGVAVLRDPGYNVASWNLRQRPLAIGADGSVRAGGHTLRFFHFTKVDGVGETMLRRAAAGELAVWELLRFYRERLRANAVAAPQWAYAAFSDGAPITKPMRVAYRTRPDLQRAYPDPFKAGPDSFAAWWDQFGTPR